MAQLSVLARPLAAVFLCAPLAAQDREVPAQEVEFEGTQLTLALPAFDELEEIEDTNLPPQEEVRRGWLGSVDDSRVQLLWYEFSAEDFTIVEPEDITDQFLGWIKNAPESNQRVVERDVLEGTFGIAPYADLVRADIYDGTEAVGEAFYLAGLLPGGGYAIQLEVQPMPEESVRDELLSMLREGVSFVGEVRDPEWSEEEVEARQQADFTEAMLEERLRVYRTKHYIVLGNSSGDKAFGKKLEEYYKLIQKTFGFEESEGRRLMPVFLWRTREQYYDFCEKNAGMEQDQARMTAGYAWKDFYTTYYDSPQDPTHIHELTHQLFKNRLRLNGGGSWFHEGVAEYMEAVHDNSQKAGMFEVGKQAPKAEDGERMTFRELIRSPSLAFENSGHGATKAYRTAGTVVWFLVKDKRTKDKTMEYMNAIGSLPRGDMEGIERELRRLFDVDLDGFEEMYLEFWKKPKK